MFYEKSAMMGSMNEHMAYDRLLKDIFMQDRPRFCERVVRLSGVQEFLNVELPTTLERRADLVVRMRSGIIRHIEFQSYNDGELPYRQGVDCLLISQRYKQKVWQTVVFSGSRKLTMPDKLNAGSTKVKYSLIDIRDFRAGDLMKGGGPGDFGSGDTGQRRQGELAADPREGGRAAGTGEAARADADRGIGGVAEPR